MSLASLLLKAATMTPPSLSIKGAAMDLETANNLRTAALAEDHLDSVLGGNKRQHPAHHDEGASTTKAKSFRCLFYEAMLMSGGKREAPASFKSYQHAATGDDVAVAEVLKDVMWRPVAAHRSASSSSTPPADAAEEAKGVAPRNPKEATAVDKELQGFVYFFTAKTGSVFDNALTAVAVSVAGLVVAATAGGSASDSVAAMVAGEGCDAGDGTDDTRIGGGEEDTQQPQPSTADNASNNNDGSGGGDGGIGLFRQQLRLVFLLLYGIHNHYFVGTQAQCYAHGFEVLFRVLLQYHDPLLTLHLDQRQVDVGSYAYRWVRSLFASPPSTADGGEDGAPQLQQSMPWPIWDWLFAHQDRLMPTFVVLAALIERRAEILRCATADACRGCLQAFDVSSMFAENTGGGSRSKRRGVNGTPPAASTTPTGTPTTTVVPLFTVLPRCATVKDLIKKAKIAARNTPVTALTLLQQVLFPDADFLQRDPQDVREHLLSFVALPVDAEELVTVFASPQMDEDLATKVVVAAGSGAASPDAVPKAVAAVAISEQQTHRHHLGYVVLDCRSQDSFNFARLPTALHVGDAIGFDAELLQQMRQRFESAKGSHLCVLGTGRALVEEINLLKLIVLHLTQHGFPYVSVASGGFKALIPFIKSGKVEFVRGGKLVKKQHQPSPSTTSPSHSGTTSPSPQSAGDAGHRSIGLGCVPQPPSGETGSEATPSKQARPTQGEPPQQARLSGAELGHRAEELRHKAASWGWGVMQSISDTVGALKQGKDATTSSSTSNHTAGRSDAATAKPCAATQAAPATADAHQKNGASQQRTTPSPQKQSNHQPAGGTPTATTSSGGEAKSQQSSSAAAAASTQVHTKAPLFTTSPAGGSRSAAKQGRVEHDDEDDELDLITSVVPVSHPAPSTVAATHPAKDGASAPRAGSVSQEAGDAGATPPTAAAGGSKSKPSVMDDDDFDFLYTTSASSPAPAKPSGPAAAGAPSPPSSSSTSGIKAKAPPASAPRSSSTSTSQPHPFDDIFV